MAMYDPVTNSFTYFESIKDPEITLNLPLMDESLNISQLARKITNDGNIILKSNLNNTKNTTNDDDFYHYAPVEQFTPQPISFESGGKDKNAEIAYKYLVNNGIPSSNAAGIVGNLYHEDLGNPDRTVNDSHGTKAFGIAGFNTKGELPNLIEWASKKGIQGNPNFQQLLDFIIEVIKSRKNLQPLLNNKLSVVEASYIWGREFEKFAGKNGKGYLNINDPEHVKRAKTAQQILNKLK